jgi:hypothetical protein
MFEFKFGIVSFCFSFIFVSFEESCLLVCGVQVVGAAWRAVMRIVTGDLVQRTGDGRTDCVLDGRTIERSGGAVSGLQLTYGD